VGWFGTVHAPARLFVGTMCAAVVVAVLLGRRSAPKNGRSDSKPSVLGSWTCIMMVIPGLIWAISGLALIPVSAETRSFWQPGLAPLVNEALATVQINTHSLALDTVRGARAWAFGGLVWAMGAGLAVWGHQPRRLRRIARSIVWTGVGLVIVAWAQNWLGASHIWWFSSIPESSREAFFGTLVNPNHAGTLCALAVPLGLMFVLRTDNERWLGALACAVLIAGVWSTHSRGALLAMLGGAGTWALLIGGRAVRTSIVTACGLIFGWWLTVDANVALVRLDAILGIDPSMTFGSSSGRVGERPQMWRDASDLLELAPWAGVGPGGFRDGFATVKTLPNFSRPSHAHQDYLQTLIEHGWLIGSIFILIVLAPIVGAVRVVFTTRSKRKRQLSAAFVGSAVSLGIAASFGFPLRIGALAVIGAMIWGSLVALQDFNQTRAHPTWSKMGKLTLLTATTVGAVGLWTASLGPEPDAWLTTWQTDKENPATESPETSSSTRMEMVENAIANRPLDTRALLRLAQLQRADSPQTAINTVNLATRVYPTLPWVWMAEAQLSRELGLEQQEQKAWRAFFSLNLPESDDAFATLNRNIRSAANPVEWAKAVVPERADRQRDAGRILASLGENDAARQMLQKAADMDPSASLAFASHLLRWGEHQEAWEHVQRVPDRNCRTVKTGGKSLLALKRAKDALEWFTMAQTACGANDRNTRIGLAKARGQMNDPKALELFEALIDEKPQELSVRRSYLRLLDEQSRHTRMIPHLEYLLLEGKATGKETHTLTRLLVGLPPE